MRNVQRAGGPIGSEGNRRRSHGNELRGLEMVKCSNGWPTDPLRERAGGPAAGARLEAWEQVLARPASMEGWIKDELRNQSKWGLTGGLREAGCRRESGSVGTSPGGCRMKQPISLEKNGMTTALCFCVRQSKKLSRQKKCVEADSNQRPQESRTKMVRDGGNVEVPYHRASVAVIVPDEEISKEKSEKDRCCDSSQKKPPSASARESKEAVL
ncbi:hypothetical protein B0H11DRAFT_1902355 [Mycena galericulata]|nr:hypothetical protein B0H11DRAFT_1902355 [Mycena galericulata]